MPASFFDLAQLVAERQRSARSYLEFLRVPALSAGLYVLPAGGTDRQKPHTEDEVYYIISGRASMRVGDQDRLVAAGAVIFVPAHLEHHFHTITEDLAILVFFAPAETG
jgi:mannose-6-phosphate isomerase-like protein (cupin superfamily)